MKKLLIEIKNDPGVLVEGYVPMLGQFNQTETTDLVIVERKRIIEILSMMRKYSAKVAAVEFAGILKHDAEYKDLFSIADYETILSKEMDILRFNIDCNDLLEEEAKIL